MVNFLKNLISYIGIMLIVYLCLSFLGWSFNPGEWHGFWRFAFAIFGIGSLTIFGN